MFEKLANIFRIPDLRKRVLFTLAMLAVYRLGGHLAHAGRELPQAGRVLQSEPRDRFWVSSICFPAATCAG